MSANAPAPARRRRAVSHALRVSAVHARTSALEDLQYRSNAWVYAINAVLELGISIASLWLVFHHTSTINGWTPDDLLVVLGCYFALGSVVNGVIHLSTSELAQQVRKGTFDFRLLKPVDSQLVAMVQRVSAWRALDLGLGLALVVVGLVRGHAHVGPVQVAGAVAMFVLAVTMVAGFWLLVSSIVFWTIQGEGILYALDDTYENLRWPVSIFPPGLRFVLSTVFPAGLAITVPAEALTGRLDWGGAAAALAMALLFAVLSRRVWKRALRRYEGASS